MGQNSLSNTLQIFLICLRVNFVTCSVDGVNYMSSFNYKPWYGKYSRGEDPCNPLYWYPKNIPEYCQYRNIPLPSKPIPPPLFMPLPGPMPPPAFLPMPPPPPVPPLPSPSLPFGVPILPTSPMLPVASLPYFYPGPPYSYLPPRNLPQAGMVPGIPGLVSQDNGINILPFSDVYSDLLESHKNRIIRRRLQKLIHEYEDFPSSRSFEKLRKYAKNN